MSRRRLIWKVFVAYLTVVAVVAFGVVWAVWHLAGAGGVVNFAAMIATALWTLAALLGAIVFWNVHKTIHEIRSGADRFAKGDMSHTIHVPESEEFGSLADALNRMAVQLDEKIRTITQQSHEQQAMLSSMIEGVLAIDNDEHIISLNRAAASLMSLDPQRIIGKRIQEVVRNTQLQRFITNTLASRQPVEADIVLPIQDQDRYLQLHGTVLSDPQGRGIGALVVLHDVTRIRKLENIRRDFVANVSHELKTPITSIKGFIESLREGGMSDPEQAERFLSIIARQADRLNAIIEDLLRLSRIEQDGERGEVELQTHRLLAVLQSAVGDCQQRGADRRIGIELSCPPDLYVRINGQLIEQAVFNLLDNAIKYSESDNAIQVQAAVKDANLVIRVRDHGCGIPAEHLSRIFERFYRVDKARSRKQGGTGLGLAIVKHIAQAHRGSVAVESTIGLGSTFTIQIPVVASQESAVTTAA